jgi:hypothetical protein
MAYKLHNIETPLKLLTTINAVDEKAGTGGGGGGTAAPSFDYENQPYKSVEQLIADTRFRRNYRREFYSSPSEVLSVAGDYPNATGFMVGGFELFSTAYGEVQDGVYRIEPIDGSAKTGLKITCVKEPTLPPVITGTDENQDPIYLRDENEDIVHYHFRDVTDENYDIMSMLDDTYAPRYDEGMTDFPVSQIRFVTVEGLFTGFALIGKPSLSYSFRIKTRQPAGKRLLAIGFFDYVNFMGTGSMSCLTKFVPSANTEGAFATTDGSMTMTAEEGGPEPYPIGVLGICPIISGLELNESVEIEFFTVAAGETAVDPQADIDADTEIENVLEKTMGVLELDKNFLPPEEKTFYSQLDSSQGTDFLQNFKRVFNAQAAARPITIPDNETSFTTSMGDLYITKLKKIPPVSPILSGNWVAISGEWGRPLVYAVPKGMEEELDPPMAAITGVPAAADAYGADDGYPQMYDLVNNSGADMATGAITRINLGDNLVIDQIENGDTPYKELSLMVARKIYLRPRFFTN